MAFGKLWAGKLFGTNQGNVFVQLDGEDAALVGTARLNDTQFGLVVYAVEGAFDGTTLSLVGRPVEGMHEGVQYGTLTATATLNSKGDLNGQWSTDLGSAGTFILFPHDQAASNGDGEPNNEQLHTVRHNFGAVVLDRDQITLLADEIQKDFRHSQVVVTIAAGMEQSRYLKEFKTARFNAERATIIKLFVQERETDSINRVVVLEFGPEVNFGMTQGSDEAWVLGMLEKLKHIVRPYERSYATNIRRLGFGTNQVLLFGAVAFLPSLANFRDRALMLAAVLALAEVVKWLHRRYLPFAALYLGKRPEGFIWKLFPTILSWFIAVTSAVVAALIARYLDA